MMNVPVSEEIPREITISKDVVEEVSKLQIEHGDVLLLRIPENKSDIAQAVHNSFRQWLSSYGFSDVRLLVITGETKIEAMSELDMANCGWVRRKRSLILT